MISQHFQGINMPIDLLHPKTWLDWLYIYLSIGAIALIILLIQALRSMPSSFARNLMRALGHKKSIKEIAQDWMVYIFASIAVLIGWPGFLIWLVIDKKSKAKDLEWQKLPNFTCSLEFLLRQVSIEKAESENYIEDPLGYTPNVPFGHLNKAWQIFIENLESDDEIWFFEIPKGSKVGKYQIKTESEIRGYAILRQNQIIDELLIECD
jgi:hypothetical protein